MTAAQSLADTTAGPPEPPLMDLAAVTKHYRGSGLLGRADAPVQAVSGVSLAVAAGQTVGIVGESGCAARTGPR